MSPNDALPSPGEVKRLWDQCKAWEEQAFDEDARVSKERFTTDFVFGPLLPYPPSLGIEIDAASPPGLRSERNERDANKYRKLVKSLRDTSDEDQKWQVLAMWLKQEHIWEPKAFLPGKVFRRLVDKTFSAFGPAAQTRLAKIRPAELLYANAVQAWVPYFTLLRKARALLQKRGVRNITVPLKTCGFDSTAIMVSVDRPQQLRSELEATYNFVAARLEVGADTVQVAHSRVYGPPLRKAKQLLNHPQTPGAD